MFVYSVRARTWRVPEEPCCKPRSHEPRGINKPMLSRALPPRPFRVLSPRLTLLLTPLSLPRATTWRPSFRAFSQTKSFLLSPAVLPPHRPHDSRISFFVLPSFSRPFANPHCDPSTLLWLTAAFRILLRRGTEEYPWKRFLRNSATLKYVHGE